MPYVSILKNSQTAVVWCLLNKGAGSLNIFREPAFLLYFCGEKKHHKLQKCKYEEEKHAYDADSGNYAVQLFT